MTDMMILFPIVLPLFFAAALFALPGKTRRLRESVAILAVFINLLVIGIIFKQTASFSLPWLGEGLEFSLRLYNFSAFIILAAAGFAFLTVLYSCVFFKGKDSARQFYAYLLISLALVNGAVLADNLLVLLLFWEGLLLTIFAMIALGGKFAFKTASKALIICGITDLCMMLGIAITGHLAGTLTMSRISLPLNALGSVAFVLLMIGAISKAGSMPFHSWIPDAATDAPLPFMAFLPAALEKLLGIYFLARISLDMFSLLPGSGMSTVLSVIGAVSIVLAGMMALIQSDYKRLLSYCAISQAGYMILGIGTAVPAGIVGGLFHMINHAIYKSGLFLTAGSVEKQAGTTELSKLGGLGGRMPVTFMCFLVFAASISGVPPFNGFFSKELVYEGALEKGMVFYVLAVAGSFFTAASFLKLGHAAFLGKKHKEFKNIKEAPFLMLVPMAVIAGVCVLFGVYNALPLQGVIQPIVGWQRLEGHNFSGLPSNSGIVLITLIVLIGAVLNHMYGVKVRGSAVKAADHIRRAPVLSALYDKAERRYFDPYDCGIKVIRIFSAAAWRVDRGIDWMYASGAVKSAFYLNGQVRKMQSKGYFLYLSWALAGVVLVVAFLVFSS